ncbi:phage head spike fiber domain-containing protein, partial [Pseudooceanicola marinus]|uniref:phage head spike fiber domain-containing protein n=3 Tax=Pseudooceanicola marinus TaxID=396013 RepID=UPI000CA98126
MIGIGTGAITLAGGAGNWVARDPVARNAHLFFSPETGRFAKGGVPASFSQMGTFEAAGTRYERTSDGAYLPRGVDVPRLADFGSGERRWFLTGEYTNLLRWSEDMTQSAWVKNNGATVAPGEILSRLGLPCAKINIPPGGDQKLRQFVDVTAVPDGTPITYSFEAHVDGPQTVAVRPFSDGAGFTGGQQDFDLDPGWNELSMTVGKPAGATAVYFSVMGEQSAYSYHMAAANLTATPIRTAPVITEGSAVTSAPELFNSDLSGFDLSGGVWVFFDGAMYGTNEPFPPYFTIQSDVNNRLTVFQNTANGVIRALQTSAGAGEGINGPVVPPGDPAKFAVRFEPDNMAFIVGGVTAGTVASVGYPAGLSDFHLGARDAGGAGKP